MSSIDARLAETRGRGPNFDLIRLVAASLVLVAHAFPLTTGNVEGEPLHRWSHGALALGGLAVGIFFATSGFLVTASAERSKSAIDFAWRRGVRLFPALAVTTVVLAFAIGPALSTSPDYFAHREPYTYLLNIAFLEHYKLPGVFAGNPTADTVNGSLWTLGYEVACYVALCALARAGLLRRRGLMVLLLAPMLVVACLPEPHGQLLRLHTFCLLGSYFMAGGLLYLWRDVVPLKAGLAAAAVLVLAAAMTTPACGAVAPLCVAYVAVWVGLGREIARLPGDFSYGVYLWGFPLQQIIVSLVPGESWKANLAIALPLTLAFGGASWFLVEKPALRFKAVPVLLRPRPLAAAES